MKFYRKNKLFFFKFSMKNHIKLLFALKMIILTLFELLKPIKTDRKSIVVSGSLDITSGSRLEWPFMPKQGPRCLKPIKTDRS